jgi:nucleotide-binding universal stress UspA family protein
MHVLLPTDGSDVSLDATRRGLALLSHATKITMLSVISDLPADTGGGIEGPVYTPEQEEELRRAEERQAAHALADTHAVLDAVKTPESSTEWEIAQRIEAGDPAAVICTVARELAVDVIVIGSHGKGFLSRVLLGSVSEHVTRHAPCPVLVVRPSAATGDPA